MSSPFEPPLDKPRHLRYWQRCARTLLPHHYTANDSQRLTLGFFIIAAIDLLSTAGDQKPLLTPADRRGLRDWVLSCQHPHGGFCGSPSHVFPRARDDGDDDDDNKDADGNANIAATYFALLLLPMLTEAEHAEGGAYAGVDRARTLRWLRRLQRVDGDGSFGEVVYGLPSFDGTDAGDDNRGSRKYMIGGGRDMRYCLLAASIRWMLRGDVQEGDEAYVEDIDVAALVRHIHRSQSYDGGFSESLGHESHAGYAYCAVAALAVLDRPVDDGTSGSKEQEASSTHYTQRKLLQEGIGDIPGFISFLVSRQFSYLEAQEKKAEEDDEDPETANFQMAGLSLSESNEDSMHIGYNGRCNKVADTCYTWWVLGSLSILGVLDQSTSSPATVGPEALSAARTFLLDKTQHAIGGFGKRAADPPDIYHSSLGLFALATMGDPSLKKVDAGLAVSVETVGKIEAGRRGLLRRAGQQGRGEAAGGDAARESGFGRALVDMAVSMGSGGGERSAWLDAAV